MVFFSCNFPKSLPKSAVIDMEPSAVRLHLSDLPLEHHHQHSAHFSALIMPNWCTDRMERGTYLADLALHKVRRDRRQFDAEVCSILHANIRRSGALEES